MIDSGNIPTIIDVSFIYNENEKDIPFHWGDLEIIGYAQTSRYFDHTGSKYLTRHYTGPGIIKLNPQNVLMKTGTTISD